MSIVFDCPHCPVKIHAPETAAGHRVSCPRCNRPVEVPHAAASSGMGIELDFSDDVPETPRLRAESGPSPRRGGSRRDRPRASHSARWIIGILLLILSILGCWYYNCVFWPDQEHQRLRTEVRRIWNSVEKQLGEEPPPGSEEQVQKQISDTLVNYETTLQMCYELCEDYTWIPNRTRRLRVNKEQIDSMEGLRKLLREKEEIRELKKRLPWPENNRRGEAAALERARLAQLEADRRAEAKRDADREAAEESARLTALKAAREGLRTFEEAANLRGKACRDDLAKAEAKEAKRVKDKADTEADTEKLLDERGLSTNDKQYVRGYVDGRFTQPDAADPGKRSLDVTKPVKDGDVGVPQYPKRFLGEKSFGNSSDMRIVQILSGDEMVIFPGYLCLKGVSSLGLTAGLKDGSRAELKEVTVVVDGKRKYTNGKGEEVSVPRLIVVDFKKVAPVMKSDTLKKWLAAATGLAEAKASVALRAEAARQDERTTKAELARRMAEIAKLSNP